MNILILNWRDPKNPKSGGAERVTIGHAREWVKSGHRVVWFTSRFPDSLEHEVYKGVEIVRRGTALTVFFYAPIFYFFSGKSFDVVIDEIHGIPFFTPLYVKKPKIAFIHEVAGEIWDYMYPLPLNLLGRLSEQIYFLFYKKIPFWTDASSTIDDLEKFSIKRSMIVAIPCPIDNPIIQKLPRKENNPTFIFVSRVVKMKGIEDIIDTFRIIRDEYLQARLWVVGDGDRRYIDHIKQRVKEYALENSVIFYGRVSEEKKLGLMRKSHLLLHASVKEGWGLVVLEAASQATPAVVYDVSGLKDTVLQDKTGIRVSKNTPNDLAQSAVSLLKDQKRYRTFQANCLSWVSTFTWENVSRQSLFLLKDVVNNKGSYGKN